jgi:putative colanic acid biosynthesis acetyltransferase WcaF
MKDPAGMPVEGNADVRRKPPAMLPGAVSTVRLDLSIHRSQWSLREKVRRAIWIMAWTTFGRWGPRFLSPVRVALLRHFGAHIGSGCMICGRVKVLMPWNLELGDHSVLAERVDVYNFGMVRIGRQSCISQGVWLCTGTHDVRQADFALRWLPITIGDSAWIGGEALVLPGAIIGDGTVVGARAVVSGELDAWTIYAGNPARNLGPRELQASS